MDDREQNGSGEEMKLKVGGYTHSYMVGNQESMVRVYEALSGQKNRGLILPKQFARGVRQLMDDGLDLLGSSLLDRAIAGVVDRERLDDEVR